MLVARVCERVCCSTGELRVGFRDAVDVASVAGVSVRARVQSAIVCGCENLEVVTRTLGVCTAGVAGEIGGGAVIMGWVGRWDETFF